MRGCNAGIDDADFDSGARVRSAAEQAPRGRRIDQLHGVVQVQVEASEARDLTDTGDGFQPIRGVRFGGDIDRVDQRVGRAGDPHAPRQQLTFHAFLRGKYPRARSFHRGDALSAGI